MKRGVEFPPVAVFIEPGENKYWLADGFHRLAAAKKNTFEGIWADVYAGDKHDALYYALGANADHGIRRSVADKNHAVGLALKDKKLKELSSRDIGTLCNVSHTFVNKVKKGDAGNVATKPTEKDKRQSKKPLTQEQQDRYDFLDAVKKIRAFPYEGSDAIKRMGLVGDDQSDIDYAVEWISKLGAALRGWLKERKG